jgi:ABC-type nitrate/sulfonate/bicarbonate transport system substrate-binding protein
MGVKTKERLLNILIFLGVLALLFVVGYPQYKESLPSKIKIGVDKSFCSVPFYVAKEDTSRRYFNIEKVEPEFVEVTGDPLQGLKDGLYDIVAVPWYSLMISPSSNGDTAKAFGGIELKSSNVLDGIMVPPKSRIKKRRDLKGKRLGYLTQDEYLINLILVKMEEEDKITKVTKVPLEPEEIATVFEDKKVDALYLIDPYRGYMSHQGYEMLFEGVLNHYIVSSLPYTAFVMRRNFVKEEDKLAAIRVKNAIEATFSYLTRNPKITRSYILKMNNWPDDGELKLKIRAPEYQRLAEVNLKSVEIYQTELVKMGIGTCGIKPSEFLFDKLDFTR